ncbi:hypothetical protein EBU94_03005 [bacterium]|jgi:hypothetical protein|nr:hypothetical protein [bacterium]
MPNRAGLGRKNSPHETSNALTAESFRKLNSRITENKIVASGQMKLTILNNILKFIPLKNVVFLPFFSLINHLKI